MCVKVLNAVSVFPYCTGGELSPLKFYTAELNGLLFYVYRRLRLRTGGRATKKSNSLFPGCFILILRNESKFVPVQAMKAYRGTRRMTPFILNLEMVQFTPQSFLRRERSLVPTEYQNERDAKPVYIFEKIKKKLLLLPEFEPTIVDPIAHYCIVCVIRLYLIIKFIGMCCR